MTRSVGDSAIASASSLIALQLLSRLTTFALNQALFRLASPTAFGAASIQLDLVLSTILFLSREGVRGALLRIRTPTGNLAFLPILAGLPLAVGTAALFGVNAAPELRTQPNFYAALALYAGAAVTELLSEPLYNAAMTNLKIGVRVRAEGLGVTVKSITTFLVLLYDAHNGTGSLALVAFALGQLMYSLVVLTTYITYLGVDPMRPVSPSKSKERRSQPPSTWLASHLNVDPAALQLSFTLTLQSLVKHFLTEGDKVILSLFSPLSDQGGYAIAVNYGSLIARIIFQPIEETLRVFFSRTISPTTTTTTTALSTTLTQTLHTQSSLSLLLLVFAPPYLPLLLPILLPAQYLATSAPRVLAAWVWCIPVLAVNGALEAFLGSVATPGDLNRQSRYMIAFSTLYITAALAFYRAGLGDASLVYANIVNLSVRIAYCLRFAVRYFSSASPSNTTSKTSPKPKPTPLFTPRAALLPPFPLLAAGAASALAIRASERYFGTAARLGIHHPAVLAHILIGVTLGLGCAWVWWCMGGRDVVRLMRGERKKVE